MVYLKKNENELENFFKMYLKHHIIKIPILPFNKNVICVHMCVCTCVCTHVLGESVLSVADMEMILTKYIFSLQLESRSI